MSVVNIYHIIYGKAENRGCSRGFQHSPRDLANINEWQNHFGRYYCIYSEETKEIRCRNERNMVHYILQPHHIFIRVEAFVFYAPSGRT